MSTEAESRAAAWLQAWDEAGVHRTGTAGDAAGATWLAQAAPPFMPAPVGIHAYRCRDA